ncbi:hypothetical protein C1A50_0534 [Paenibacillus polymyxa]|nr:hypothetical protein C1A50_0534 [Paenibacillus polymyxa]
MDAQVQLFAVRGLLQQQSWFFISFWLSSLNHVGFNFVKRLYTSRIHQVSSEICPKLN